ncbi:MAG: hypothetical protein ABIH92_05415 [Nanoarchaeota archaeon]
MKNVKKVREIKSKVKIIKEIGKDETEGDKEIKELTSEEIPLSEGEVESFTVPVEDQVEMSRPVSSIPPTLAVSTQQTSHVREEEDTGPLYDVGRTMGGEAGEAKYKPVDTIQSGGLRELKVGKAFAMHSGGGGYPEAHAVEGKLREEAQMEQKKYESERDEGGSGSGGRRKYPWEI